jgi:ERCC4-related helicase
MQVNQTELIMMFTADQQVQHPRFGTGTVLLHQGSTVIVRFSCGIESCLTADLSRRLTLAEALAAGQWSPSLPVRLKAQAAAIRSINDAWGVFSRSRIDLLPHQLWVCHRALQQPWPIRLLIADDVGLGKTVEAGLILWPLIASGKVRRLLILTPAALVRQWQFRLKSLFDIRLSIYDSRIDTDRTDYWSVHNQVVASLPTLRSNQDCRHERILEAEPWDMVIVDEAHHLNVDEGTGKTLGFAFLERLLSEGRVGSCLFFSGTPHRGKPLGFWSLMSLLRPDLFNPQKPEEEQLPRLREVLIRNFKPKVTDMLGRPLFKSVSNTPETFIYSDAERDFYNELTRFILAGNAYASELSVSDRRQVMLVLIAMQKIASSSVAAIRSAMRRRLAGIRRDVAAWEESANAVQEEGEQEEFAAFKRWVEQQHFQLMHDEIRHLETLLEMAEKITEESKICRIGEIIDQRFSGRSVLLFTEYKATQALMISTLMAKFGKDCVGFINGDDRLEGVCLPDGRIVTLRASREQTADRFNQGGLRFLVSTEAAGEGIDLQVCCHTLIHIDLPWNPMRLHQRVGRLNRYGQRSPVDVVTVRNPDTVEARIWGKLEKKLEHIMQALGHAMDEPEDLMQMILGMAGPQFFNELFVEGSRVVADSLDAWFDAKAGTLGGRSAVETVTNLVGQCQSFDLSDLKDVPRVDLPDLIPFFHGILVYNKRRPEREDGAFSFRTPSAWQENAPGVRSRYDDLIFRRNAVDAEEAKRIVGIGHQVFERALAQAVELEPKLALVPADHAPLALFRLHDAVTTDPRQVSQVLIGVTADSDGRLQLLRDSECLKLLNQFKPSQADPAGLPAQDCLEAAGIWLRDARVYVNANIGSLKLQFRAPLMEDLALLWRM